MHDYADPLDFIHGAPCYRALSDGYRADTGLMATLRPAWQSACGAVYVLPAEAWARRVSGLFANQLVACQGLSCAVLSENADGSYLVSVRSDDPARFAACGLCERFPGGGGRRAAAGINRLPASQLDHFVQAFSEYFAVPAAQA